MASVVLVLVALTHSAVKSYKEKHPKDPNDETLHETFREKTKRKLKLHRDMGAKTARLADPGGAKDVERGSTSSGAPMVVGDGERAVSEDTGERFGDGYRAGESEKPVDGSGRELWP